MCVVAWIDENNFYFFNHAGTDTNILLESYHNRLKTFFLNRGKLRRVDDLLELILNFEEDDY